jgi:hypothetical protein
MSVHVTGSATPNPVTEFVEPASPITGQALVAGASATVQVGPYQNNSNVTLKITAVTFANQTNCTVANLLASQLPINIPAGGQMSVGVQVTPSAAGQYSFDVSVTVTQ